MSHLSHQHQSAGIVARSRVLTVSDTRTTETDLGGRLLCDSLTAAGHVVTAYQVIPDDPVRLRQIVTGWLADPETDAILCTGGTGISRRDQTVPVIESLVTTPLPGFGELFRMLSYHQVGSAALLSRATAGVAGDKLLFALPGSIKAVQLALDSLILPQLRHLLYEIRK